MFSLSSIFSAISYPFSLNSSKVLLNYSPYYWRSFYRLLMNCYFAVSWILIYFTSLLRLKIRSYFSFKYYYILADLLFALSISSLRLSEFFRLLSRAVDHLFYFSPKIFFIPSNSPYSSSILTLRLLLN